MIACLRWHADDSTRLPHLIAREIERLLRAYPRVALTGLVEGIIETVPVQ